MSKTCATLSRTKSIFCELNLLEFSFAQLKSLSASSPENERFKASEPKPSPSTEYPEPRPMEARQSSPEVRKCTLPVTPPLPSKFSCIRSVMSPILPPVPCHLPIQPNPPVRSASENARAVYGLATITLATIIVNHNCRGPISSIRRFMLRFPRWLVPGSHRVKAACSRRAPCAQAASLECPNATRAIARVCVVQSNTCTESCDHDRGWTGPEDQDRKAGLLGLGRALGQPAIVRTGLGPCRSPLVYMGYPRGPTVH